MVDIHEVKVGTLAPFVFPYDKSVQSAKRIEELGYDSMWYPDHLMGWLSETIWTPDITPLAMFQNSPHTFPDPLVLMAAHATATSKITLGTSVTETIRRHPAVVAQTALTLDHISGGRTILGLGAGEIENVEPYGMDFSCPVSKLEENLRIIRLLWSDQVKKKDFQGKFTSLKDAVLTLEPYKKGKYPPIWLGAMGPRMLRITGELADGWLPVGVNVPNADDLYRKNLGIIHDAAKKVDRDPDSITAGLYAMILVAKTHDECHELFKKPLAKAWTLATSEEGAFDAAMVRHPFSSPGQKFNVLTQFIPTRYTRAQMLEAMKKVPEKAVGFCLVHGTKDEIIGNVEKLAKAGLQHIVFWNMTGMIEPVKNKESLEILKDVLRYIKGH
ncbi:MAG: LLM class flavin-dependent oxidoreductase [Candidatus Atabeyarchaeum deiterrae]